MVIGGLFSSTLVTLFVIPAVYSLFDGLKRRCARGDYGIDLVEPGRPAEAIIATNPWLLPWRVPLFKAGCVVQWG